MTKLVLISVSDGIIIGRRRKPPKLKMVSNGDFMTKPGDLVESRRGKGGDDFLAACHVLEAQLEGEHWFLEKVRSKLLAKDKPEAFPSIFTKGGHNNLIQITQFMFLLEALDCTDPSHISAFVDSHNEKINADLKSGDFSGSEKEIRKAIFTPARKLQLCDTFAHYQRPVFSIYELGHLLIDLMSAKTTENIVNDLLYGGWMRRRGVTDNDERPIGTDPSRILVEPTELLVATYAASLIFTKKKLAEA